MFCWRVATSVSGVANAQSAGSMWCLVPATSQDGNMLTARLAAAGGGVVCVAAAVTSCG